MFSNILRCLVLSCALAACGQSAPAPAEAPPVAADKPAPTTASVAEEPSAEAHAHGVPGAAPGSHDDWCGGHAVPESMCTRCNPKLIAAFKATGDWCAEHALPESQCLLCNPDLKIVRPPKSPQ